MADTVEVTKTIPGEIITYVDDGSGYLGSPAFSDGGSPYRRAA
eukprot:COSAG06_NODE_61164_length_268_cov_1.112426_1_plen_42_part_10